MRSDSSNSSDQDGPTGPDSEPGGIPRPRAGRDPAFDPDSADEGAHRPLAALPEINFWDVLYGRRSIRKFSKEPVPREWIDQVLHAGFWAPSSCNYQMWDLVAVTDEAINRQLGELSTQMANAPVNVVVSYGRDFSEEAWANIQSASALIQNMSLAAHALGLGTFWITQTGGAEKLREVVGLPRDRIVVAVLAIGFPKATPKRGPKRRPFNHVAHFEHYAGRPIPSSVDPEDWAPDLLATYQRARVLNGLRHNKPRSWEQRALLHALDALLPHGKQSPDDGNERGRWLDVLPCTGIVTAKLATERKGYRFDVAERSLDVAQFCAERVHPKGQALAWPDATDSFPAPGQETYDVVSCFFRLEGLAAEERRSLVRDMARWVRPGGALLIGFVSATSFHGWTEALRARRGGPKGVEYVLSPDPGIGPFQPLAPRAVEALIQDVGFTVEAHHGEQPAPPEDEVTFRTRNMSSAGGRALRAAAHILRAQALLPSVRTKRARFRYLLARAR